MIELMQQMIKSSRVGLFALVLGSTTVAVAGEPVHLFNGKDLTGWQPFLGNSNVAADQVWTVTDGVLRCSGKPAGYIKTDKEYGDYMLTLEWRWPEKPGNSGVLLHQVGPDKVWPKSIESQLQSGHAGDFWVIDGTTITIPDQEKRQQGRRHLNLNDDAEKPLGEWNKYEITCKGGDIKVVVNGKLVNEATNASVQRGAICLQSEGAVIEFRNIQLQPLND